MEKIARKKRTACRAEKTASLNKLPRETESFAQAFSKACRVQRQRLWSPLIAFKSGETKTKALCKGMNFKTAQWAVLKEGRLCKISSAPNL